VTLGSYGATVYLISTSTGKAWLADDLINFTARFYIHTYKKTKESQCAAVATSKSKRVRFQFLLKNWECQRGGGIYRDESSELGERPLSNLGSGYVNDYRSQYTFWISNMSLYFESRAP